jgi:NADP-dependent aldehyde dehydrogenase
VFATSGALRDRADDIAAGLVGSFTFSLGQLCTKPGIVFHTSDTFASAVRARTADVAPGRLLNDAIEDRLRAQMGDGNAPGTPTVIALDRAEFARRADLHDEHFGPVTVLVRCESDDDLLAAARTIEGSLTATVHAAADDPTAAALRDALAPRSGRLVWNGWPTGVAVTGAMHHGGPYPATTASLHTSVGDTALRRFLRPVCYQAWPDALLPPALQDANPLGITRLVDGEWTSAPVQR